MCGIAGYCGPRHLTPDAIEACLGLMRHRGPDDAAHRAWDRSDGSRVNLLHTRLSIIDLDPRANQPFQVNGKWLIYNGELYNYKELRERLVSDGARLTTHSDTEVLLQALDRYGWDVLDRCEGMWAFAVYDELAESLSLCRDRFGEKPLYIHRDETGIYFASEVKFIFALLGRRMKVNHEHIYRYLVNGYKSLYKAREMFFAGLEELAPATFRVLDRDGRDRTVRYWEPQFAPKEEMTFEEAVAGVRERLIRSVEIRLRADVPIAFCLSGGVDSNGLISIARNLFDYDAIGFTIANRDERYEENEMVHAAVKELGIRHVEIPVETRDFLPRLRELVRLHDAPVYTITYYAQWLLMRSIAEHGYRISVSGTAADELFSGYYDHHLAYLHELRGNSARHATALDEWNRHVKPWVRNPYLSDPLLFDRDPQMRDHIFMNAEEFSEHLIHPWREPFRETHFTDDLLRCRMLNELFHENVPVILHEDDLNAMSVSVENRSPYLDRGLFDFCGTIPTERLIRDGRAKAVLRAALRGVAPDVILDSPRKVGFNAPIFSYLDVANPDVRAQLLDDSPIFDHFRRSAVEQLLDRGSLPNSESKFLFNFLCSKIFLEEFAR